jgi:hypothetical protein
VKGAQVAFAVAALSLQLGLACGLAGCGAKDEPERNTPVGTVIGYVRLEAGALLPMYPEALIAREPLRPRKAPEPIPEECTRANQAARLPVSMSEARGLSGMLVTASEFRRSPKHEAVAHRVRIERCALRPQTIAMSAGDRLVLENRDAFPFAPLYGPAYEARPLPRERELFIPVVAGSIEPLSCSSDAPCGRSDVFVLRHAVHAVSDDLGAFRIANFPAGEQVRLTAIHPLFEESETALWVEPNETVRVELHVRPKPHFIPHP